MQSSIDMIFDKHSKRYPDSGEKVLKYSDFKHLVSCDEFKHSDFVYLSKVASSIPLDIFSIMFMVSDPENKGYMEKEDFRKLSQQLLIPRGKDADFDTDINKLLFFVFKIYENKTFKTNGSNIYNLNHPIKKESFINFVKTYNKSDLSYLNNLIDNTDKLDFDHFSQLMNELPKIKLNQSFQSLKNGNNQIDPSQLKQIAQTIFYNKLPPLIADHLEEFASNKYGSAITYDDAFNLLKMIRDLPKLNYLTYEKISHDKNASKKIFLTSSSLYNYIQQTKSRNKHLESISNEEILLYFSWNRFSNDYLKKNPSIHADELLAILTDDLVIPNENTYHSDGLSSIFKSIHSFVLGSVAGMIGATIVYPIDMVKTRMQNQKGNSLYTSYLDCFKKIVRNEGLLGMYSGLLPQIVGVAPEKAIKLTLNDLVRAYGLKQSKNNEISPTWEIIAGSTAGFCQVIVTNPLEISKIRMQIQGEQAKFYKEQGKIFHPKSVFEIVRELGLRGLYRGAPACLLRDVPFSSIYFPSYAHIKKNIFGLDPGKPGKRSSLEAWELLVAGAVAGMPAAFLTTPCDVVKTRIQSKPQPGIQPYVGISNTFKRIVMEEGAGALFKGGIARVCRSSPQFGFTLAAYELFQKTIPLSLFYDTESQTQNRVNQQDFAKNNSDGNQVNSSPGESTTTIFESSKRFKLSSSASTADLNPTLLALTNYYQSLKDKEDKKK